MKIEVLRSAIEHYGENPQIIKTIEELSELSKELCKYMLKVKTNKIDVIGEIVDVQLMLTQVSLILSDQMGEEFRKEYEAMQDFKIKRLADRIAKDKEKIKTNC